MAKQTKRRAAQPRRDLYQDVTNTIIQALEAGVKPWEKPWDAGNVPAKPLRHNGLPYRGINVLLLWMAATAQGYTSPFWMTYRQAQELGGQVRKGERSTPVVYYGTFKVAEETDEGEEAERNIRFLKSFNVFCADQIESLPAHFYNEPPQSLPAAARIEELERFAEATKADIRTGGMQAYYSITGDFVQMPPFETFREAEAYYSTLAHELTHWTRHPSRLDRDFGRKQWGDEGYAKEELVAELGSAFLGAEFGFRPEHLDNHAAYVASWLQVLKNDKRFIFSAAAKAQAAADYLLTLAGKATPEEIREAA